jgi:hypothetical protein
VIVLLECLEVVLARFEDPGLVFVPEYLGFRIGVHNAVKDDSFALFLKHLAVEKLDLWRIFSCGIKGNYLKELFFFVNWYKGKLTLDVEIDLLAHGWRY